MKFETRQNGLGAQKFEVIKGLIPQLTRSNSGWIDGPWSTYYVSFDEGLRYRKEGKANSNIDEVNRDIEVIGKDVLIRAINNYMLSSVRSSGLLSIVGLVNGFLWAKTSEGHGYWRDISNKLNKDRIRLQKS